MQQDKALYRERVYNHYAEAVCKAVIPDAPEGLAPRRAFLLDLIRRHFPANRASRILDLGCGHGALLYFAKQQGYENLSGVDRSPEQVAAAKKLGLPEVQSGDLMECLEGLPKDAKDMIITFDVLEHFSKAELIPFVDQIRRVLAPGGTWIIHVPNGESPMAGRVLYGDLTHEQAFTVESIHQLLKSSSFDQIQCYEDQPIVHGLLSGVRMALWKLIRLGWRFYLAIETGDGGSHHLFSQNFLVVARKTA